MVQWGKSARSPVVVSNGIWPSSPPLPRPFAPRVTFFPIQIIHNHALIELDSIDLKADRLNSHKIKQVTPTRSIRRQSILIPIVHPLKIPIYHRCPPSLSPKLILIPVRVLFLYEEICVDVSHPSDFHAISTKQVAMMDTALSPTHRWCYSRLFRYDDTINLENRDRSSSTVNEIIWVCKRMSSTKMVSPAYSWYTGGLPSQLHSTHASLMAQSLAAKGSRTAGEEVLTNFTP